MHTEYCCGTNSESSMLCLRSTPMAPCSTPMPVHTMPVHTYACTLLWLDASLLYTYARTHMSVHIGMCSHTHRPVQAQGVEHGAVSLSV
jgi:hypothetical protein